MEIEIKCCNCGTNTLPSIYNMCRRCLSSEIDISSTISKTETVEWCKACERYLVPPKKYQFFEWNSVDLLAMLLRKNKYLENVKLISSKFLFTEVHSKRILIEVVIEKEVDNKKLKNTFQIKYTRRNKQCSDCENVEAKQYWNTVVQLRQKSQNKRNLFYIEQMIIKHKMYQNTSNMKEMKDGMDFYYLRKSHAKKMVRFLESIVGCKIVESDRLISLDTKSNIAKSKNSFSVEIFPISVDDLILLSDKISKQKNLPKILLVKKVTTKVKLVCPHSGEFYEVPGKFFWNNKDDFEVVMTSKYFVEFNLIDFEKRGFNFEKSVECSVSRNFEEIISCRSYLKNKMEEGAVFLGYDIKNSGIRGCDKMENIDCILVRSQLKMSKKINIETNREKDIEYEYFLEDVAEDAELRTGINIYDKSNNKLLSDLENLGV